MSFILDALKKSETERQHKSSAEFAGVPTSNGSPGVPRWLWIIGLLLAINLVVLLGLVLRPGANPEPVFDGNPGRQEEAPPVVPTTTVDTGAAAQPSFEERVAAAREYAPPPQEPAGSASPVAPGTTTVAPVSVLARTPSDIALLPTFHEVRANGTVVIPDLHLDIHVFSEAPNDRFVFINMSKQRESSTLSEGPYVQEITPQGVVLDYQGTAFLLPRD